MNIATDNLYKFIALTGLVIISYSVAFPFRYYREVENEIVLLNGEIKIFNAEFDVVKENGDRANRKLEFIKNDIERFRALTNLPPVDTEDTLDSNATPEMILEFIQSDEYQNIIDEVKKKMEDSPSFREKVINQNNSITSGLETIKKELTQIRTALMEAKIKNIQLETKGNLLELKKRDSKLFRKISIISLGLGLLLSYIGFRLWYYRLQKYQDILTKKDFSLSEEDENKSTEVKEGENID